MGAHRLAGILVLGLISASPAAAQQDASRPQASQAQPAAPAPTADSLGVSLKGVRREAKGWPAPGPAGTGLRYDFIVDVLGRRPKIDFFKDFDLSTQGAVRWGGVTHQEILNAVTPYPFKAYMGGMDVLALTRKK
jgi:hypothetical protein